MTRVLLPLPLPERVQNIEYVTLLEVREICHYVRQHEDCADIFMNTQATLVFTGMHDMGDRWHTAPLLGLLPSDPLSSNHPDPW